MANDLNYAFRYLRRHPGYTAAAVLTLALGIGPSSAVFAAFDHVLLKLLPVEDPRRLVLFDIDGPPAPGMSSADNHYTVFSHPQYLEYRQRSEVFEGLVARTSMRGLLVDQTSGERVNGELVSGNFFPVLGLQPALGRLLSDQDDQLEGGHPVAVISHQFWTRRFGSEPSVVGRSVRLNGLPVTIVGVVDTNLRRSGRLSPRPPRSGRAQKVAPDLGGCHVEAVGAAAETGNRLPAFPGGYPERDQYPARRSVRHSRPQTADLEEFARQGNYDMIFPIDEDVIHLDESLNVTTQDRRARQSEASDPLGVLELGRWNSVLPRNPFQIAGICSIGALVGRAGGAAPALCRDAS